MISTINKIGIKGKMANMCEFIIAIIFDDDFIITIKYQIIKRNNNRFPIILIDGR